MMYFIFIFIFIILFNQHHVNSQQTVCYPPLSCYISKSYSEPYFLSTSMLLAEPPKKLNTSIVYYPQTKQNWIKSVFYKYDNEIDDLIAFNVSNPIVFIVHGYKNNAADNMFSRLKDYILKVSQNQVNVFAFDWSQIANHYSYSNCIANLPVLGDSLAYFIERLLTRFQISPKNVHLIGHSLGAHLIAYTGQRLIAEQLKLGKITGLDPAGPYLRNLSNDEKLDSTDADVVEVYYTGQADYLLNGLGTTEIAGKINIYLNGGSHQPHCETTTLTLNVIKGMSFESLNDFYNCDHHRGFHIYETDVAAQTKCQLVAYKCETYEDFLKGKCGICDNNNTECYLIGYQPHQMVQYVPEINSKYHLVTTASAPWCIYLYQFIFEISNYRQGRTGFIMHLTGETNTLANVKIEISNNFEKSNNVTMLLKSDKQLDRIERVQIENVNNKSNKFLNLLTGFIYDDGKLEIDRIHVNYMSNINPQVRLSKSSVLCYQTDNNIFKFC